MLSCITSSFYCPAIIPTSEDLEIRRLREAVGQKHFHEMVTSRDVEKEDDLELIQEERLFAEELTQKLDALNSNDVLKLAEAINTLDCQKDPILLHPDLPYLGMEALRKGLLDPEHGPKQAATLLNFWSALQYHKDPNDLQTVELFIGDAPNPQAVAWMKQTFITGGIPFLEDRKFDAFMNHMRQLPLSEQRFLLVPDLQGDVSLNQIGRENRGNIFKATISQVVKDLEINVFNRVHPKMRLVPSVGMMQAFLDAQYDEPIEIKPRIYRSTAMQIRECGLTDRRDMMMPFPDPSGANRCPATADGYAAPWYDFPYHDFYHAILASAIGKRLRRAGIAVSDVVAEYANQPDTKSHEGLQQLATSILDLEYNHFQHFLKDSKTSTGQTFWNAIVAQVKGHQGVFDLVRQLQLNGFPAPFEVSPISEEEEAQVIDKIYHALVQ